MRLAEIWRYPVKSMLGESLAEARLEADGVEFDRAWAVIDQQTGLGLTARRAPELLFARARVETQADGTTDVVVVLPDGTETNDDETLSRWLGRDVELRAASPDLAGTYEIQLGENEDGEIAQWNGPTGSFHDSARSKVSLASSGAFGDWDQRRFRLNLILDGVDDESSLVGHTWKLGGATFDVTKQIDRCVMISRPQAALGGAPPLQRDIEVLRSVIAERGNVLGVGALISTAGSIRVGDEVEAAD